MPSWNIGPGKQFETTVEFIAHNEKFACSNPKCGNTRARASRWCRACFVTQRHYGDPTATRISTKEFAQYLPMAAAFVERQLRHGHAGSAAVIEFADQLLTRGTTAAKYVRLHDAPWTSRLDRVLAWLSGQGVTPRQILEHVVATVFLLVDKSPEWKHEALARSLGRFVMRAGGSMLERNRALPYQRALGTHMLNYLKPYISAVAIYARDTTKASESLRQKLTSMPIPSEDGSL